MDPHAVMREHGAMIRIAAALLAIATLGTALEAQAAGACRPTRDGKDRIERAGGCPDGYFVRGACCESVMATSPSPQAGPSQRSCPAGTVAKLGFCIPSR